MHAGKRVAVVVPAFREARLIGRTISAIPQFVDIILVVDDASDDETVVVAQSMDDPRVRIVQHPENRGVGAAIVSGYAEAFALGMDVAVVMAGDAQMDPLDLPALLAPVTHGEADYAKGNRLAFPGVRERMPFARYLGNHVLSLLTRMITGLAVTDSQCGYTALTREAAERLPLERLWPRYGYPNDLLGEIAMAGLRSVDVVVRPIYADEVSGIGLRHALFVVPYVLMRVAMRRMLRAFVGEERSTPSVARIKSR
jgi:glycosyltransferase involved in cell wall biosynthesis